MSQVGLWRMNSPTLRRVDCCPIALFILQEEEKREDQFKVGVLNLDGETFSQL